MHHIIVRINTNMHLKFEVLKSHLHMKTHSSDHMITITMNTTAVVMTARCGMFSRRVHSFSSPLGFRLVFLYFL